MADKLVFISYKHEAPWSEMAAAFYLKLNNVAPVLGFEIFFDKTMLASVEWRDEVDQRLERTTHLVAFLCDPYWASEECKRELHVVLKRYEAARAAKQPGPKLLFVRAGNIDARFFTFDEARRTGVLSSTDARIGKIADVNFLGPYDLENNGKLEVLARNDPAKLDDQLAQLFERLRATLG